MNINPTVDNITTALKKELDKAETILTAWKNVKRVKTKSGSDYKIISKNFTGCSFIDNQYSLRKDKKITVFGFSKFSGHVDDEISTTELIKYSDRKPAADRVIKEMYLEPYFIKNPDEIEEDIQKKIKYWIGRVNDLRKQIESAPAALENYKTNYKNMIDTLKKDAGNNTTLFYMIIDNVNKFNAYN